MKKKVLQDIFTIRICIGYLGEADKYSWWSSSFFSPASSAFLSPVFSKTGFTAQYYGVREAATLVHDEHIGIGKGVFHLFRLPESREIEMHRLLDNPDTKTAVQKLIKNKDSAEQFLCDYGRQEINEAIGPVRSGDISKILNPKTWKEIAAQYVSAFKKGNKVFPYFTTA